MAIEIVDLPFKNGDLPAFQHSVFLGSKYQQCPEPIGRTHEGTMWHS
jgi:hypothetical protein